MTTELIDTLAEAISNATFEVDADERATARAIWSLLATGRPVTVDEIATEARVGMALVSARLDSWPGVFRNGDGHVVGFWGLALPEMNHRFQAHGGAPIYAWCALDPMLIVPILGRPARIDSKDPISGEPISLTVTPSSVEAISPAEVTVSILTPERAFDQDVILTFCNFVHFFASRETGESWIAGRTGFALVSPHEALEIGRRAWSRFAQ